jgi:hypothetical protein
MSGTLQYRQRDLSTRHSSDFAGQITGMMRSMRKLEAEDIVPKSQ